MRKHYSAAFVVGQEGEPGPSVESVRSRCLDWLASGGRWRLPDDLNALAVEEAHRIDLANGAWVETAALDDPAKEYWAMRLGHPDSLNEQIEWQTELCVSRCMATGETTFSCTNLVGDRSGIVAPTRTYPSRPRIVRDILSEWGGHRGAPFSLEANVMQTGSIQPFLDMLKSQTRVRPLVLISACNRDDSPIVDADGLADWLGGVAHVFVAKDRFVSLWDLDKNLPERLSTWDGAIRVYWPGFSLSDPPFHHRIWPPHVVRKIEGDRPQGFKQFLLGLVSNVAVFMVDPAIPGWSHLDGIRKKRLLQQARDSGDQQELLDFADQLINERDQEVESLGEQIRQVGDELRDALAREDSWKQAYLDLVSSQKGEAVAEQPLLVPLDSVADAIQRAQLDFSDTIVFALNSSSDGSQSLFENPDHLFAAFEFLARTYHSAKTGQIPCADFDGALREVNGWRYKGQHSELTMKKYENWYTARLGGEKLWLTDHLGTGSSKDPRRTIRVGFCWDDKRKRVVIGFLGQHQKSDAT